MTLCQEKHQYPSYRKAHEAAVLRRKINPIVPELRVYRCNVCGKFHLTSQPSRYEEAS